MSRFETSFAVPVVGWLADYYLLATLLMLVVLVARRWVRQPLDRLAVAWVVMLELVVLAVVCALPWWPRISLVGATTEQAIVESAAGEGILVARPAVRLDSSAMRESGVGVADTGPRSLSVAPAVAGRGRLAWKALVAVCFLAGAGVVGLWLCWGMAATAWLCRRATPASEWLRRELSQVVDGNGRAPRLLVSGQVTGAVALGVLRPTIVLPARLAEGEQPEALRVVLSHEWAHIRNRDLWLLAVGRCVFAVLFAHPLFWWLRRAIRGDQELLADAAAAGENRESYAEELLRLVRATAGPSAVGVSAAVGIWEGSSQISRRIAMLLSETFHVQREGARRWRHRALGLLLAFGAVCSLVTLQPVPSGGEEEKSASAATSPAEGEADQVREGEAEGDKQRDSQELTRTGGGTLVITGKISCADDDASTDMIILPGYTLLMEQAVLKELGITADQKGKLMEVQKEHEANSQRFYEKVPKDLPQKEKSEAYTQWQQQERQGIKRRVEEVLTPGQVQTLDRLALSNVAFQLLPSAKIRKRLGMSARQKEQLSACFRGSGETTDPLPESAFKVPERALALLSAEQRVQLREAALGPEGPEAHAFQQVSVEGEPEPMHVPTLFPYPDLGHEEIQKKLGLGDAQREQVRAILGESPSVVEKLAAELKKSSPEERKKLQEGLVFFSYFSGGGREDDDLTPEEREKRRAEVEERERAERTKRWAEREKQPLRKMCARLRTQMEAVLQPDQLAAYKDIAVRDIAEIALRDPLVLRKIAVSEQQKDALRQVFEEAEERFRGYTREQGQQMLKVLTPEQKDKLREEMEKQWQWWK